MAGKKQAGSMERHDLVLLRVMGETVGLPQRDTKMHRRMAIALENAARDGAEVPDQVAQFIVDFDLGDLIRSQAVEAQAPEPSVESE